MAKNKVATLEQVANEMNEVMAYGCDENGKLVDESEQIDVELSDKALLKVIKDRAKEDLRAEDEGSFSPEVWDWFIDQNLAPKASSDNSENDPDAEEGDDNDSSDDDAEDADYEEVPPKKADKPNGGKAAGKGTAKTPEKAREGDSKASKPKTQGTARGDKKVAEKGNSRPDNPDSTRKQKPKRDAVGGAMAKGGNEKYAVSLVEDGAGWEEFLDAFTKVYTENKPDADDAYILSRSKIYWNIAHKKLGKETPPTTAPSADTKKDSGDKKSGGRRK